jgi:hypothetical protein
LREPIKEKENGKSSEEEKDQVSKRVLQAITNTESTIDLLRESYDVAAYKRLSDIIVAQELSLNELRNLNNELSDKQ